MAGRYTGAATMHKRLILFTKRDGTGNFDKEDIYTAFSEPDGTWNNPISIAETINSQYNEGTCL